MEPPQALLPHEPVGQLARRCPTPSASAIQPASSSAAARAAQRARVSSGSSSTSVRLACSDSHHGRSARKPCQRSSRADAERALVEVPVGDADRSGRRGGAASGNARSAAPSGLSIRRAPTVSSSASASTAASSPPRARARPTSRRARARCRPRARRRSRRRSRPAASRSRRVGALAVGGQRAEQARDEHGRVVLERGIERVERSEHLGVGRQHQHALGALVEQRPREQRARQRGAQRGRRAGRASPRRGGEVGGREHRERLLARSRSCGRTPGSTSTRQRPVRVVLGQRGERGCAPRRPRCRGRRTATWIIGGHRPIEQLAQRRMRVPARGDRVPGEAARATRSCAAAPVRAATAGGRAASAVSAGASRARPRSPRSALPASKPEPARAERGRDDGDAGERVVEHLEVGPRAPAHRVERDVGDRERAAHEAARRRRRRGRRWAARARRRTRAPALPTIRKRMSGSASAAARMSRTATRFGSCHEPRKSACKRSPSPSVRLRAARSSGVV